MFDGNSLSSSRGNIQYVVYGGLTPPIYDIKSPYVLSLLRRNFDSISPNPDLGEFLSPYDE